MQESRHKVPKSVLRAVLGRMQFTFHAARQTPHGASRLVLAMSAWLMKTRRAPSGHSRDARVYGHTTTAMHELSTPPPPLRRKQGNWKHIIPGMTAGSAPQSCHNGGRMHRNFFQDEPVCMSGLPPTRERLRDCLWDTSPKCFEFGKSSADRR